MLFEILLKKINATDDSKPPNIRFNIFSNSNESPIDNTRMSEIIDWAKKEGYLEKLGIHENEAKTIFQRMQVENNLPEQFRNSERLRKELLDQASDNAPLSADEAKRAYELVKSGEILHDIFYSYKTIFSFITEPNRISGIDDSLKSYIGALSELPDSIGSDLNPNAAFDRISRQIELIKKGEELEDPTILDNTLKTIFSTNEVGDTIELINNLLAPNNQSLRTALLVYARLNGINLEQTDIDEVRNTLLDKENPQLGSLFAYLLEDGNALRLAGK